MKKNDKDQPDDDIETLMEKGFKLYHSPPPTKPRCFNVLIGATVFLLWFLIMTIVVVIRTNTVDPMPKDHVIFKSFIQKSSITANLGTTTNDIIKPIIDKKEYRGLELPNGMKIMMISDPDSSQGSAAVNVRVGSFADPLEMGGLAHFCEHMVFLKSREYPELNGFQKFVSNYNGNTNAFTKPEDTNYYFQTASTGFEEALSRFSKFFIDPVFTEDLMSQEVSAIDGELGKNLNDAGWRLRYLLQITSNPESVLYKFTTGSSDALMKVPEEQGLDVVQKLQNFYDSYYSSNLMTMAVVFNKPLDEMETLIRNVFSEVPNKNSNAPNYERDPTPFTDRYANRIVQYGPVNPAHSIQFIFSVKPSSDNPFLDPYSYITRILVSREEGGLLPYLADEGLANDITVGLVLTSSKFDLYMVDVDLSDKGLQNIPEVSKALFSYIDLIKKRGVREDLYNQYARISNYTFNYIPDESDLMGRLSSIAANMQSYSLRYGVSGSSPANSYDKELLTEYINELNVDNLMVFLASPNFNVSQDVTDTFNKNLLEFTRKESKSAGKLKKNKNQNQVTFSELNLFDSLYGIHYNVAEIPSGLLDELKEVSHRDFPELKIPKVNDFVPTNFDLVEKACAHSELRCVQNYEADALQMKPNKIYEDDYVRIWHQLDRSSGTPMIVGDVMLYSEETQKDLIAATLASLKAELINLLLQEQMYDIALSGNSVNIGPNGFKIEAFGDVFLELMSTVLKKYKHFEYTEEQFNMAKDSLVSRLYYGVTSTPYMNLIKYKARLLLEHDFLESEMFEMASQVGYSDFKELITELDKFPVYSEILLMGNILEHDAKRYGERITRMLDNNPAPQGKFLANRVLNLAGKNYVFRSKAPIGDGTESFILNSYQVGVMDPEKMCYLNLLNNLMEMEVYTYLRTEQQMCYIVQTFPDRARNILSMNILVQSSTLNPNEMDEHIEIALKRSEKKLKSLTEEEFDTLVESYRQTMSDQSVSLHERSERYLNHIVNQDYMFNMKEKALEYIPNLTKRGLLSYFDNLFKQPNKLSIQFYNNDEVPTDILPKSKQLSKTEAEFITGNDMLVTLERYSDEILVGEI